MFLKELRMWHWRQAMDYRAVAKSIRESAEDTQRFSPRERGHRLTDAANLDKIADFHIRAVQGLNDHVPGTAEQDCQNGQNPSARAG